MRLTDLYCRKTRCPLGVLVLAQFGSVVALSLEFLNTPWNIQKLDTGVAPGLAVDARIVFAATSNEHGRVMPFAVPLIEVAISSFGIVDPAEILLLGP